MIKTGEYQRVLYVTISVPPVNVLDTAACNELADVLKDASLDEGLSAVIISGEGKCFSAGASVEEHTKEKAGDMITALGNACKALDQVPVPTVAQVNGFCFGGAFELAMYCDFIVADPDAVFGVPEITLAFFPPLACSMLPRIVGPKNAAHMIFTGRSVKAEQAMSMGIVQEIIEQEDWGKIAKTVQQYQCTGSEAGKRSTTQRHGTERRPICRRDFTRTVSQPALPYRRCQ